MSYRLVLASYCSCILNAKKESTEEFFAQSRGKDFGIKLEIINGRKVRKYLQPGTKKLYSCPSAMGLVRDIS
jgi:hypothetical protein